MRYLGGGHKKRMREIDFKRKKFDIPATVKSVEYDPMRSARIALLYYADGAKSYIIAAEGLKVGQTVISGEKVAPEVGNALPLGNIPLGTIVHNIELKPGKEQPWLAARGLMPSFWLERENTQPLSFLLVR